MSDPTGNTPSYDTWYNQVRASGTSVVDALAKAHGSLRNAYNAQFGILDSSSKSSGSSGSKSSGGSVGKAAGSTSLLPKGTPNSKSILYNPDGTVKQERWYGADGNADRDRDHNHPGNMPFPHDHMWENGKRGEDHLPPSSDYKSVWDPSAFSSNMAAWNPAVDLAIGGYAIYTVAKWGLAGVLAPTTGGTSFGLAAAMP